ncbi:MAG: ABC transporter substrate-binding protein [Alphaproteobacteria bacterium]|nr:ABC transporter substrate-binding protein [Alphaproteobacteria bacterium]
MPKLGRVTRRRVLALAGTAAAATALGVPQLVYAQNVKPINFTLPWVADGSNLYVYVAKEMGLWQKHGLDVSVARGSGSIAAAEAIGAGRFDFGLSAPLAAVLQTVKGLPTMALAACAYDAAMGIGVPADGPIKTPKDLEGHKMACTVTSGEYPFLPAFADHAGFDLSKVSIVQVDNKVRDSMLPQGNVDALSGFATTFMASYIANNFKARAMLYSRFGIPNYGNALMTQPKRLEEAPELCGAMVDGLLQGLKATLLDPDGALKILLKSAPELALSNTAREQVKAGTGLMVFVSGSDIVKAHGMGYFDPGDIDKQIDLVMKFLAKPEEKRPSGDSVTTNRFAGQIKFSDDEWKTVQKGAAAYSSLLT